MGISIFSQFEGCDPRGRGGEWGGGPEIEGRGFVIYIFSSFLLLLLRFHFQ